MKQSKRHGLKWITFSAIIFFAIVILAILWLFQVFFLNDFYISIKTNKIQNIANNIQNIIYEDDYQYHINQIISNEDCLVWVYENDQILFQSDSNMPDEMLMDYDEIKMIYDNLIEASLTTGYTAFQSVNISVPRFNRPHHLQSDDQIHEPPKNKDEILKLKYYSVNARDIPSPRLLLIEAQLSPLDATVETIKTQLIIISIVILIAAVFVSLYLSRRLSIPLIKIFEEAKAYNIGEKGVLSEKGAYREVDELSVTLNSVANEFKKVEEIRREYLSNLSHDLRTPLTMIAGYAEVIRDIPGENTAENFQVIIDESMRLNKLVNDILDLTRFKAGVYECSKNIFNITDLIRAIIQRHEKFLVSEQFTITFDYENDVYVNADEIKIEQVIYNLLANAVHYCGAGKKIHFIQSEEEKRVCIKVIDDGAGIAEEKLPYIWERYYTGKKLNSRSRLGSGLGLSIAKAIFELHKLEYGVTSKVNEGTCFYFYLDKEVNV